MVNAELGTGLGMVSPEWTCGTGAITRLVSRSGPGEGRKKVINLQIREEPGTPARGQPKVDSQELMKPTGQTEHTGPLCAPEALLGEAAPLLSLRLLGGPCGGGPTAPGRSSWHRCLGLPARSVDLGWQPLRWLACERWSTEVNILRLTWRVGSSWLAGCVACPAKRQGKW